MNHIYKVVWSKVKNCYVVVSEIAHNSGKEHSSRTSHSHRKGSQGGLYALALAIALGLTSPSQANADAPTADAKGVALGNGGSASYDAKNNLNIGNQVQTEGDKQEGQNNTAIGTNTDTLRNVTEGNKTTNGQPLDTDDHKKLVDSEGQAHDLNDYKSTEAGGSTAVGYNNHNEGDRSTTIGNTAKITNKPVTYYVDADGNKTASQDDAAWYKDSSGNPTKVPQVFRDANGNTTTTTQYVHTTTTIDDSGQTVTKTEITTDKSLADKNSDGTPVYSYQASDNTDHLYTVTLYQASQNSIAAGTDVTANGSNAVVVGYNSTADNSAVAIGDTAAAKENGVAIGKETTATENAVAIGKNTKADVEGSIALGKGSEADRSGGTTGWDPKTGATSTQSGLAWKSTEGALSIGNGSASRQITGVAAGSEDTDAVNLAQLKNAMTHYYSVKTTADTDAAGNNNYLNDGATGDNALAAGVSAVAMGDNATAVGTSANATASQATAIGSSASATSSQSTAIGNSAGAHGDYATALGNSANASSTYATAIGAGTIAPYYQSTAVGASANATATQATALGSSASATSSQSTAIGNNAGAHGDYAIALGDSASATNTKATALGSSASATSSQSTAIGNKAQAQGDSATALGDSASATYSYAVAIGSGAGAYGNYATALGSGARATSYEATAIGSGAAANGTSAIAMGNGSSSTDSSTIAIGSGAGAHNSSAIALGSGASANSSYGVAIGNGASAQNGDYGIAIGSGASTQYGEGTALGHNAKTTAPNGTALGSGASAYYNAIAIGASSASGSNSLAAGNGAYAQGYQAIALGDQAKSYVNGGLALGSNSTAYRESGQAGLDTVSGALSSSTEPAWKSTYGAISVGNFTRSDDGKTVTVNGTRQIVGVAAGTEDTDAVNVAQLKAALRQTGTGTIHDYSVNSANTTTDTNYNYDADTGSNALAAGVSAKATGMRSVAVGNGAKAQGADSIAIGTNAVATGQGAMVIGQYNTAEGQNSLAFGGGYNDANKGNKASSTAAVAFGEGSWAVSEGSVAFGYGTQAGNTIKDKNGKYTGQNAVAFGNGTKALGGRSLAFGENTTANYNDSVAFGNGATAYSSGAVAFGNRSRALSQYATSFGDNSVAAGSMSFAFGTDNIAGAALDNNGALELTDGSRMDSYGNKAYTTTDAAGKTTTYSIKGMGIPSGGDTHDYVVVTGTKADGTTGTYVEDYQGGIAEVKVNADGTVTKVKDLYSGKYGGWYQYDEQGNIIQTGMGKNKKPAVVSSDTLKAQNKPIPVTLDKATPGSNGYTLNGFKNATAFGHSTEASGDNATAFGNDTKAKEAAATAFGTTTTASGVNATAFGLSTTASGDNATAFGEGSTASGEAATAFGISSNASGKNSLAALGGTASAENAAAIGSGAQATLSDSVALGSNSKTTRAKYSALTDAEEKAAYAKGSTSTGSAWEATDNAIAVGNDSTTTRQITGVAAGSLDTDAVNVAQLRAVDAKHTIVTVGGNSVTADNTPVNGGNLDLKRTTATNGQETYDLSLDKNVTLGEQVENNGGKLTVNNVDKFKNYDKDGKPLPDTTVKEAVKIDGKTVSVVKHDGSAADNDQRQVVLGVDQDAGGYVALYDNTGKKPTYIYNAISGGITYLKDKDSYLTPDPTNPNDERASNEFNRLEYGDYHTGTTQFIATLDDGQKYAGDNYEAAKTETKTVDGKTTTTVTKEEQNVLLKKLNERLDIKGGATGVLTDKNIGVNVKDGVMNVQLVQNIDLGDQGSVKMGNTTINKDGVTITPTGVTEDTKKISLTDKGLSNGGKTITNVADGTDGSDAVNVSQLNAAKTTVKSSDNSISVTDAPNGTPNHAYDIKVATATLSNGADGKVSVTNPDNNAKSYATGNSVADAINKAGFTLTISNSGGGSVDGATNTLIHPGDTVTIDAGRNISLKQENGKISIATKDNLNLGSADSKDDKQQDVPGTDGSITVNGKNGSAVAINGKDGSIGLTGPKGTDGKSTSIQISTIMSTSTLDDGKNIKTTTGEGEQQKTTTQAPRIQYKNGDTTYKVATMDDGQKYGGDNYVAVTDKAAEQNVITKKLNERLDIKGGAAKDKLTEKNIGVNVENGVMKVQLAQNLDLDDKGSVKMGNTTINNGGVTITTKNGDNTNIVSLTENGLNNGGKTITNVGNGTKDSDAVNVSQLNAAKTTLKSSDNSISVTENPNGTPNHAYDIKVATATLSNETDGKVSVTNPDNNANSYATGNSVANAINNSGFKLIASASEGTVTGNKETLIHPGDTVTIDAGKNISLTQTDSKISIATKDKLVLGKDTSDGKDGQEGTIGLTGKDGLPGADGKQGYSTTIIKTEKGQAGKDGKTGKENLGGTDITRIVYTDKDGSNPQTVATLSDGLKFAGDDMSKTVDKKLNETLQIRGDGTYDKEKNTVADDGNIKTSVDNGAVKVSLSDKINLHQDGYLTAGGSKNGNAADGNDPIVIKHFDDKTLDVITGVDKEGKPIIAKVNKAGDYVTGLDNKDWNVDKPEYVSGRAATEDQLKTISDTIKSNAETAAGQHTAVTVNDKDNETTAPVGTDGKYSSNYGSYSDSSKGNLLIAAKTKDGQTTYNIKLNDQLAIGQKGVAGKDGQDGKVTVETSKGTTVVIGHDGEPGKDGKDGISVKGQDGKDGVTISVTNGKDGKDGSEGHIGLTGPKGADGKDGQNASADIHVKNGQVGVDGTDGNKGTNGMDRVVYEDHNHVTHEVATMDDGLKIGANAASKEKAANPVSNKLNSTINIMGSAAKTGHTYTDDNLTTTVEQDKDGNTTVKVLMDKDITGNSVTVGEKGESGTPGKDGVDGTIGVNGKDGSSVVIKGTDGISINGKDGQNGVTIKGVDGKAGTEGHIGLTGPKGPKGADGKDGQNASADIHVVNGHVGVDGTDGNKGTNGMDRVVYEDHNHVTHEVATMDDGLKFAGDDVNTTVAKKLNSTLQIRGDGTYDKEKNTVADDGNIKTSVDNGAVKVSLSDKINLHQDGYLTVGGSKNGNAADGNDPIVIKHFDDKTLDVITGVDKEGKPIIAKEGKAGDYVTGLDNKNWNVDKPEYVSGRAATENQLKTISDAVKEAATTAGKHTVVTVENGKAAGTTDYNGENLKLKVTEKDGQKTYDLKLNDKVTLGKDGVDGSIGLKGADGKSSIGLNGKDGISVIGTDGKNGVSITGSNGLNGENGIDGKIAIGTPGKDGQPGKDAVSISGKDGVGHIGLTGQKGADGKDGAFTDLSTILGTATLDRNQNEVKDKDSTKDKASRIQYQTTVTTEDGKTKTITHEVATMDDGLKFVGNDGKEVAKKLNSTLSLTGGMDKDAVAKASSKNLGVRSNAKGDGLELVMTDTPDFTKVTVGEGTDTTQKIIIGKQTVTGKKSDGTAGTAETGKYITGLDNTKWNEDNVVENRAATEGQLRDVAGSITNQSQGGGFGLADEAGNTVKKDLGQTVTVKGDGKNIETKVANGSLEVSLKKDVDLGGNGSINAGQTKVDQNGVDTNKVTIKDSGINISKDGINGGGKQITNIASGIDGKTYADAKDNNAASIGDVKNIAGKVEQNVTNVTNNVNQIGQHVDKIQTDVTQLQQDVKADRQYQGDDAATKKSVNVKFGRFLSLTGGAKVEALADEGNLGVIQQEREDPDHKGEKLTGLSIRLAKDLKGLNSVEANTVNAKTVNSETFQAGNTTINNGGLTVKGDDKHKDITVQQGSVNMGGNKIEGVAPGKVAPDSTDAVNGSQLAQRDQAIGKLGGEVSSLDRRVDRVGAGAAALAALHPQDFDPDDKWDFAVGYGNYRGANAAAVGAFYRPNEDTTLSVGGTVGGGENMVNAGISFKFGQGNHVTNSRVAMAKEILALKDYVQKQDEKIEKLEALVGKQGSAAAPKRRSILFPDVPENHWAYAYVKKLADRGLLEGYPDGEFKGDRTITRYEFAAIFSRALENGASVDNDMERMSEEFEPEIRELSLNRFRVDRVEGKDNDRHKIERVRVNDRDELVKQKNGEQKKRYRDLYGSVIEKDAPADAAK